MAGGRRRNKSIVGSEGLLILSEHASKAFEVLKPLLNLHCACMDMYVKEYMYIYIYTYAMCMCIYIYIVVAHKGSQAPELTKEGKLGPQVLPSFTKRQAAGAMFSNG